MDVERSATETLAFGRWRRQLLPGLATGNSVLLLAREWDIRAEPAHTSFAAKSFLRASAPLHACASFFAEHDPSELYEHGRSCFRRQGAIAHGR